MKQKLLCLCLLLCLLLSLGTTAMAAGASALDAAVSDTAAYVYQTVSKPQVGSIGGEWAVIGLARSGYAVNSSYFDTYYNTVVNYVQECKGELHAKKYTEYSRVILALTAIGRDPSNVGGYNLLTPLGDFDKTVWQGLNGPIWALIALDSGNYEMPVNPDAAVQATRQLYVDEILNSQLADGGFSLTGTGDADPDMTGMALQALANYQSQSKVKSAIDKALNCISNMQDADGGFASWNTSNSESSAQVLVALCALGIDPDDSRFVKNGKSVADNLLSFYTKGSGFTHTSEAGGGNDQMSTEQGFYALVALQRMNSGKNALYNMTDAAVSGGGTTTTTQTTDVQVPAVGKTVSFTDISGNLAKATIENLASRGIINGYADGSYGANKSITRAEFAAIVVRALGYSAAKSSAFADVSSTAWYAGYVGTANTKGIVNGVGSGKFNPTGTITRQEAAAMVARAAKFCGIDTSMTSAETKDMLAQFGDYTKSATWAMDNLAFCYQENILDQSDLNIRPTDAITRGEMAQMIYNMLTAAELI